MPLIFTFVVRVVIAAGFVFYVLHHLFDFGFVIMFFAGVGIVFLMVFSRSIKHNSIMLERLFINNLRSRDIEAQVHGKKRPLYEGRLLDRDIHIADFEVPGNSQWMGQTLRQLNLGQKYGVHVSSILRGRQRINIPGGNTIIFPGDRLDVIGTDEQLSAFNQAINNEVQEEDPDLEAREMKLRQIVIRSGSLLKDKTLRESGLRDEYGCMLIGMEEGREHLTPASPSRKFEEGDILWVVGEESSLQKLTQS
jgi:CPA2 family monovalent cation:H+ antiporter-2